MSAVWTANQSSAATTALLSLLLSDIFPISGSSKDCKTVAEAASAAPCRGQEAVASSIFETANSRSIWMLIASFAWHSCTVQRLLLPAGSDRHSGRLGLADNDGLRYWHALYLLWRHLAAARRCSSQTLPPRARRSQPRSPALQSTSQRSCRDCTALRLHRAHQRCSHPRTRRRARQ